jgi:hypothetical protein
MVLVLLVLLETALLIRLRRPWGRAAVCVQRVIVMRLGVSFSQQCADRRGAGALGQTHRRKADGSKNARIVETWSLVATVQKVNGTRTKITKTFPGSKAAANAELDRLIAAVWVVKHRKQKEKAAVPIPQLNDAYNGLHPCCLTLCELLDSQLYPSNI